MVQWKLLTVDWASQKQEQEKEIRLDFIKHSPEGTNPALQAATILVAMASEKKKMATELSAKVAIWRPKDISSKE